MMEDLDFLADIPPWEWPSDTDELLLSVLGDPGADETDRLIAAELAGDSVVVNDPLASELLSILRNDSEPEELRAMAAIAFGPVLEEADMADFGDPEDSPISEQMFHGIQKTLHELYTDAGVPKLVRRRILEVSVCAQEDWHPDAVRAAYSSGDQDWVVTAVFCMGCIRGFDAQILESLNSGNPDIRYEAVCAADNWELDAAWPHIAALVTEKGTEKSLLLAAIDAAAGIRPGEAFEILAPHVNSDDEDISEVASDAMSMAGTLLEMEDENPFL